MYHILLLLSMPFLIIFYFFSLFFAIFVKNAVLSRLGEGCARARRGSGAAKMQAFLFYTFFHFIN